MFVCVCVSLCVLGVQRLVSTAVFGNGFVVFSYHLVVIV